MMEVKNPQSRMFLYLVLSIVSIVIVINALRKDIDYSSFGDWLDSQLLFGILTIIGFPIQAWRAYKETKKIKEEKVE
ncbi:hypothetical protein [Dyadobacter sp. CY356]|uniref:hypothetical protein n=1 Tax=Dyadobacter sp. CY356 TaxID=2906442 RepID=UPI001F45C9BB|nr:hypothetical protein [Dyadobacter sp. CY356]MCF0058086.1 hypothetical protein [Dyadobacter sp. CY356]